MMNNNRPNVPANGINLDALYFMVFRHKWKITLLSLAGMLAAAALYFWHPPQFQSEAELLIQYVPEAKSLALMNGDQKVIVPDSRGEDVINSEIQILTSLDVAKEAVTNLGAASILAGVGGGSNELKAAIRIWKNLKAIPTDKGGGVIVVTFKHSNPRIVQPVLQEIINVYFQRHYEIHSALGQYDDHLSRESADLRVQLNETEQQLAELKNQANIISTDDRRKELANQVTVIQSSILGAQAELAGYEAAVKNLGGKPGAEPETTNATPVLPLEKIEAYREVGDELDLLRKKRQDYLLQGFTTSNLLVLAVEHQMADAQKSRAALEMEFPHIADAGAAKPAAAGGAAPVENPRTQVAILQAKIKTWSAQLGQLREQATNLNNLAPKIAQLEQTRGIQEANYHNLATSLEQARINAALATGKTPNIKWVQTPSPPFRDWKKAYKKLAAVAFGGIFAGFAWAFLLEFYFDGSVRRPDEIETKMKLPLFLAIPDVSRNGHAHHLHAPEARQLLTLNRAGGERNGHARSAPGGKEEDAIADDRSGTLEVVSQEHNPRMQPFYEALRDRLMVHFEVRNLTHKPKLVAVSSTHPGAGVSTIAAGLAASLSETGDGNVLLVDMNPENGSAQHFYKGRAGCGLDAALKQETREDAFVQDNLYVVSGHPNHTNLQLALPKRFAALVPQLRATDFDFIIFDLPPVSPTSVTSRLARFMDSTLLVVEAEKTDRRVLQQANSWLAETGANVSVVLNKTRKYIPAALHRDFNTEV